MLVIKAAAPARLREINAASARRVGCVFRPERRSRTNDASPGSGATQQIPRQANLRSASPDASASAGRRNRCAFGAHRRRGCLASHGQENIEGR
jgi:hypothetical protein